MTNLPKHIKDECNSAIAYFTALMANYPATKDTPEQLSCYTPETKALYEYARPRLETATIKDVSGKEHSALQYAMFLYFVAEEIVNKGQGTGHSPLLTNALLKTALMVALEDCCYRKESHMAFGSKFIFDAKKNNLPMSRSLLASLLAQEGDWSNRSKGDLLNGNVVAVGIYCARLKVLTNTLAGRCTNGKGSEEALEKIESSQNATTPEEVLSFYLYEFAVPYLESVGCQDASKKIAVFLKFLRTSDFYFAPCSTKYHLCRDGGLAEHTINVLMQLLWMTLPATKQELGACVLAAIGHDLCKVNVYRKQYKNTKTYLKEGDILPDGAQVKQDQGGRFYWAEDCYYEFKDNMPFGHGRKSAYMLLSYFPEIDEAVFSAVDGHMADASVNPAYMQQFAENPMALNLHIADVLATYLDECGK